MTDDILKHMMSEDEFLEHYGKKGMKWGKRNPQHESYSNDQTRRDRQIYGTSGAKRINKSLHEGNSISVARGDEKTRRDNVMGKNKYVRQGGKVAGAALSGAAGFIGVRALAKTASSQAGHKLITKLLGQNAGLVTMALNNPAVIGAATIGAAKIGEMFSGDIAVAANMRVNGYNPNRK